MPEHTESDKATGAVGGNSPVRDSVWGWPPQQSALHTLERIALAPEKLLNRLTGTLAINPFYYTGQIAVFLFVIVGLTGLYLFFLYQYGFDASYEATAKIEAQFISRIIRAIHRYGSDAAIVVSLPHAFRLLFMDRFRGPRWLAWVSGVGMVVATWLCGVSGYWMVWDQRAQLLTTEFTAWLHRYTPWGDSFAHWLRSPQAADQGWLLILALLAVHFLTSAIIGLLFWYHIRRLNRPKFVLEPHWLAGLGLILVVVGAVMPGGMLPPSDVAIVPRRVPLDRLFLFFVSPGLDGAAPWLWIGVAGLLAVSFATPWLLFRRRRRPRLVINRGHCTGCTRCAQDCPYKAISMVPRSEGETSRRVAAVDPALCVACGVCIGSCNEGAISLGDLSTEALWRTVQARLAPAPGEKPAAGKQVILTCQRHAAHGLCRELGCKGDQSSEVIPVPCVGAVHPSVLTRAVEAGAAEVLVVACPPDDCAQREGSLRLQERLARLHPPFDQAPIRAAFVPPDASSQAIRAGADEVSHQTGEQPPLSWRNLVPAFIVLLVALGLLAWLTGIP
jgi:ferredoxin